MSMPKPRFMLLGAVLFAGALASAGCRTRAPESPGDDISAEIQALESWLESHPDDDDARRRVAQLLWLFAGEPQRAKEHLLRLAKRDDALAHFELAWMAYARLDDDATRVHAQRVIELAASKNASLKDPFGGPLRRALAAPAARMFDDVYGRRAEEEVEFTAWYASLDLSRLPSGAADVLTGRRASIARAHEQDADALYAAQGCLQDWAASATEGHLGALNLGSTAPGQAIGGGKDPDPVPLSCAVRLWNTTPYPGVRRMRTQVEVAQGPLELTVGASDVVHVFVDGHLVYRNDESHRWPVSRPHLNVEVPAGPHSIEVHSSVEGERAWVSVRARDGAGQPLAGKALPTGGTPASEAPRVTDAGPNWSARLTSSEGDRSLLADRVYAPLRGMLALDEELAEGDSDGAEQVASHLRKGASLVPLSAEAQLLLADFENMDPTRARTSSGAREQAALEAAVERDAQLWRAHLRLAQIALARQDAADALARIDAFADKGQGASAMAGHEAQLLRFAAYRAKNNELLADEALAAAAAAAPHDCDVLNAQRSVAEERQQVDVVEALTQAMAHCPGTVGMRAQLAFARGSYDTAQKLYATRVERAQDDLSARRSWADVAVAKRDWVQAQSQLEAILKWAPWRATVRVALADVLAQRGQLDAARKQLERALERTPHLHRIWELASQLGFDDPIRDWRVDGSEFVANFDPDDSAYEGAAQVLVLDRDVAWVYPDGSQRHLIHQITHLRSKSALDAHGELQIPDGAQLLTLQTIKPDGRIVEPESIAGKDGLSLRELELGDMFEMEYVLGAPGDPRLPGYVDLSRFRFASFDTPYHHSELVVVHPEGMPVQVESRNGAPPVKRGTWKGRTTLTFLAKEMARHNPEPGMRSALDELPMVRVFTPLEIQDWLAGIAVQVRDAQRTNPELRAKAREVVKGATTEAEKLDRLWRWVLENIEETTPIAYPATVTLSDRKGSALMLLRVMLHEVGVRNEVWLTRDKFGPADKQGGHPLVSAYDSPMLAVYLDGAQAPVMVMTQAKTIPLGYLTPGYSGGPAFALKLRANEPEPGPRTLPTTPQGLQDARRYDLKLSLDDAGTGVVEGVIELQGLEALFWRNELQRLDVERRGDAFQAAELPRLFGHTALDLESLEISNIEQLDAPLRFEFRAAGLGVAVEQGGSLLLPLAALTMNLAGSMTTLPERETGMVIPFAPRTSFSLAVKLEGLRAASLPSPIDEKGARGRFVRTVEGDPTSFVIESMSTLEPGVVEPQAYDKLAGYAARVAAHEQAVLRLESASP